MDMMICRNCGHVFPEEEAGKKTVSYHFWGVPSTEVVDCCPKCGGDYTDAVRCVRCGEWFDPGESVGAKLCENCKEELSGDLETCIDVSGEMEEAGETCSVGLSPIIPAILPADMISEILIREIRDMWEKDGERYKRENMKFNMADFIRENQEYFKK